MIVTEKKSLQELISLLEKNRNIFIVGCGACATACATGGEKEVNELKTYLLEKGFNITGTSVVEVACDIRFDRLMIRNKKKEWDKADAIVVLCCGAGVQALREVTDKILIPGLNSLFVGTIKRLTEFSSYCSLCGECILGFTGGFCPRTRCSKALNNGPCGGAVLGKCEADRDRDCVWVLIYNYLKEKDMIHLLSYIREPLHHSKNKVMVSH
ncbi:MAG: methylenetetrahydrofolate reductase C-terminal domain-containing protein [Candidatus Hydrogenedentota bacterium]